MPTEINSDRADGRILAAKLNQELRMYLDPISRSRPDGIALLESRLLDFVAGDLSPADLIPVVERAIRHVSGVISRIDISGWPSVVDRVAHGMNSKIEICLRSFLRELREVSGLSNNAVLSADSFNTTTIADVFTCVEYKPIDKAGEAQDGKHTDLPEPRPPLSKGMKLVYDKLKDITPGGMLGPEIVKWLKTTPERVIISPEYFRKSYVPVLKQYGVKNQHKRGYYLPPKI